MSSISGRNGDNNNGRSMLDYLGNGTILSAALDQTSTIITPIYNGFNFRTLTLECNFTTVTAPCIVRATIIDCSLAYIGASGSFKPVGQLDLTIPISNAVRDRSYFTFNSSGITGNSIDGFSPSNKFNGQFVPQVFATVTGQAITYTGSTISQAGITSGNARALFTNRWAVLFQNLDLVNSVTLSTVTLWTE